jgi:hypothetical protein
MSRRWLLVLLLLQAVPARATVVRHSTLEELCGRAPIVLRGTVGQVQARWNDGRTRIETYSEILVREQLKGAVPSQLLVRTPGGAVGNIESRVSGAARLTAGEDVVLFLDPAVDEAGVFIVWAMSLGKVSLAKNHTGELRAVRDLSGITLYEESGPKPAIRQIGAPDDLGTAEAFLLRIRSAIRALNPSPKLPGSGTGTGTGVTR